MYCLGFRSVRGFPGLLTGVLFSQPKSSQLIRRTGCWGHEPELHVLVDHGVRLHAHRARAKLHRLLRLLCVLAHIRNCKHQAGLRIAPQGLLQPLQHRALAEYAKYLLRRQVSTPLVRACDCISCGWGEITCRSRVSLESRNGTCADVGSARALMHMPSFVRERLMDLASRWRCPSLRDFFSRSLPARSTINSLPTFTCASVTKD